MSAGHTRRRQAQLRRVSARRRSQHEGQDRARRAPRTVDPQRLVEEARRLREASGGYELDQRRVLGFAAAAMIGARPEEVDPSLMDGPTPAERLFLVGMAENITKNWESVGVLSRPRSCWT